MYQIALLQSFHIWNISKTLNTTGTLSPDYCGDDVLRVWSKFRSVSDALLRPTGVRAGSEQPLGERRNVNDLFRQRPSLFPRQSVRRRRCCYRRHRHVRRARVSDPWPQQGRRRRQNNADTHDEHLRREETRRPKLWRRNRSSGLPTWESISKFKLTNLLFISLNNMLLFSKMIERQECFLRMTRSSFVDVIQMWWNYTKLSNLNLHKYFGELFCVVS